ncbi:MAG TPA: HDOD domain-containing protein [Gallionella sp.]|jgi:HD-like signal output (HDOD) protein|nr:HDOD domain-containing protein [Gallionella sp.]
MTIVQSRLEIQQQKELPTLSPDIQHILTSCNNPDISSAELAKVLNESPTIAARLLGLANSSFFGQQGKICTLLQAISILGMVTVKSVAIGLALSGVFRTDHCPHFSLERYWVSIIMTAMMSNALHVHVRKELRPPSDGIYMAGLLHNLGLLALVHLYPEQMGTALAAYGENSGRKLGDHIHDHLDLDHYEAGVWLGSKWHLPENILLVMKYHYDRSYRGEHWPLVLLESICAKWANQMLYGQEELDQETEVLLVLGTPPASAEKVREEMRNKLDAIKEMASSFSKG